MRWIMTTAPLVALLILIAAGAPAVVAQEIDYFGTNRLEFEPVGSLSKGATGKGVVDYRGGTEPDSRWRASFRFSGLDANTTYVVVIRGRANKPGDGSSDTADDQSSDQICSFTTDGAGKGSCFWYFSGLARLNVVQLRQNDVKGARVMQATRSSGGRGTITTTPNRFSPGGEVPDRKATRQGNGGG